MKIPRNRLLKGRRPDPVTGFEYGYTARRCWFRLVLLLALVLPTTTLLADAVTWKLPSKITVVTDDNYPPYIFRDVNGQLTGYLVDEWALWEKKTGVDVTLKAMDWGLAQAYMQAGEADVIETIFKTPEREKIYSFTAPYAELKVPVFFHHTLSGISDVTTLKGFTIGVKAGDACIDVLKKHGITTFAEYPSYQKVIEAAGRGEVRVFCVDHEPAVYFLMLKKLEGQFRQAFVLYTGHFHRAVLRGNEPILDLVNQGFKKITRQEREVLKLKWIGQQIINPMDTRTMMIVALIVGILTIGLLINIQILKYKVRRRTLQLTQSNERLMASEEKYRLLVDNAHESIYVLQNLKIVYANPAMCQALGQSADQLAGHPILDFIPPEEHTLIEKAYADLIAENGDHQLQDVSFVSLSGVINQYIINPVRIEWDGAPATLNFATNVTSIKAVNEKLAEERKLMRTVIDHLPDAIYVKDRSGRKVLANRADIQNTGKTEEEIIGKTDLEVYPPEVAATFMADDDKVLVQGLTVSNREEFLSNLSGNNKWLLTSKLPLTNARGEITGLVGIGRDITTQKNYETTLLKQNEEFQALNEEYLAGNEELNRSLSEIQKINKELREAKLKAEESDRLKLAFLSNISHEIRTPLNGLVGFSEQLTSPSLTEEQRELYVKLIDESSQRLTAVINDIVDISLLQTNQAQLNIQPVSLTELMSNVLTGFSSLARQQNLAFTADLPTDDPIYTSSDAKRLAQIISKLVDNALKFTSKGGVRIGLRRDGKNALLYVKDSGIGISQAMQEAIFSPFRQADSNAWKNYGGQGLGLSIVRGFTELMGGKIWLSSRESEGATFWISLPLKEVTEPLEVEATPPVSQKNPADFTILAAEDESSNFIYLQTIIHKAGYNLLHATNGQEAVDQVKANPNINLVLMDIKMPVMDGYEAFRQIRSFRPDLPIIALTAFAMADEAACIKAAGFSEYLTKPYKRGELLHLLQRWL